MVVIVIIADPKGPKTNYPKSRIRQKVTYVSCVFINPLFHQQVEPGDTFATTKEGKCFKNNL